jgi:hypothetical protein
LEERLGLENDEILGAPPSSYFSARTVPLLLFLITLFGYFNGRDLTFNRE